MITHTPLIVGNLPKKKTSVARQWLTASDVLLLYNSVHIIIWWHAVVLIHIVLNIDPIRHYRYT